MSLGAQAGSGRGSDRILIPDLDRDAGIAYNFLQIRGSKEELAGTFGGGMPPADRTNAGAPYLSFRCWGARRSVRS